jgi:hypothetical protein
MVPWSFSRFEELFHAALERPAGERESSLREVRQELIRHDLRTGSVTTPSLPSSCVFARWATCDPSRTRDRLQGIE